MLVNMKKSVGRSNRGGNVMSRLPNINIDSRTGLVVPIDVNNRKLHQVPENAPFYTYDGFLKESNQHKSPPSFEKMLPRKWKKKKIL